MSLSLSKRKLIISDAKNPYSVNLLPTFQAGLQWCLTLLTGCLLSAQLTEQVITAGKTRLNILSKL